MGNKLYADYCSGDVLLQQYCSSGRRPGGPGHRDLPVLAKDLRENEDVKEFYLGMGGGERKSFKDVKSYKRRKRWLA
mgnify:CR=1 FL=1